MALTAYTATLPDDVLLDTGVLLVGGTPLSATRGGLTFNPNKEIRNIEFDGKRFDIEKADRITGGMPTITGTFIQFGDAQIPRFEAGVAEAAGAGNVDTTYTPQPANTMFVAGDYITNLRLVYERQSGGFVQVRFPVALCTSYQWTGRDKDEAEVQATFVARQSATQAATDLGVAPYLIEELSAIS